ALGLALAWGHARGATVAIATIAALAGFAAAFVIPFAWLWLTAPAVQRNEGRADLARRDDLSRLIELNVNLRRHWRVNRRDLETIVLEERTGPLELGADAWVRRLNEDLGRLAEDYLHPELAQRLTLDNPHLSTWDEVRIAAGRLDQKMGE